MNYASAEERALRHAELALAGVCALMPHLSGLVALVYVQADQRVGTACVFASGRILINPIWFPSLCMRDAVFVMAHEVMHLALQSHQRMEGADGELFNIAHDLIINDLLANELECEPPEGALTMLGAAQLSAERIVSDLRQSVEQGACLLKPGWGNCRGDGDDRNGSPRTGMYDALRRSGLAPTGQDQAGSSGEADLSDLLSEEWERLWFPDDDPRDVSDWCEEIREAARIAVDLGVLRSSLERCRKQRGTEPGDRYALVQALHTREAPPWQQAMQHWIEAVRPGPRTYNRPSRRGADRTDLVLPGRTREGWTLHLVLDTSGSMADSLPMILGAISAFCADVEIDTVHILQCDAEVTDDVYVAPEELAEFSVAGFGGSDMTPAMMRLAQDPEVEVAMVLTDGWIAYPNEPMPYDVLWVLDYANGFAPLYGQVMALAE